MDICKIWRSTQHIQDENYLLGIKNHNHNDHCAFADIWHWKWNYFVSDVNSLYLFSTNQDLGSLTDPMVTAEWKTLKRWFVWNMWFRTKQNSFHFKCVTIAETELGIWHGVYVYDFDHNRFEDPRSLLSLVICVMVWLLFCCFNLNSLKF